MRELRTRREKSADTIDVTQEGVIGSGGGMLLDERSMPFFRLVLVRR
jgi:hypothetical protein